MDENRKSKGYNDGVNLFIQFVKNNFGDPSFCPCKKCRIVNGLKSLKDIRNHLFLNGIGQSYTTWCFHREVNDEFDNTNIEDLGVSSSIPLNDAGQTRMFDLVNDALGRAPLEGLNDYTDKVRSNKEVPEEDTSYKNLRKDASRLIYPMCSAQDTKLSVTIELTSLKTDARAIQEDWERFIDLSSDPKVVAMRARNQVNRSKMQRHERVVGIHFFNFHWDEVVAVGRAIFPHNQTNNPNEYNVLVDLVIDEDAEVSGRRGMFFRDIPVGEWFKYPSFFLKIIDEDLVAYSNLPSETIDIFDRVLPLILECVDFFILRMQQIDVMRSYIVQVNIAARDVQVKGIYKQIQRFQKMDGRYAFQKMDGKGNRDGYDLAVVDTMHKANFASRICHSGRPNCEVNRVTIVDGVYQIGVHIVHRIQDTRRDEFVMEDDVFDCANEEHEWGTRMMKASLIPPVTRKYEIIDQYVIIADEKEVQQKIRVSLPEDYDKKLFAQKNGNEDMDIPEVKDYKPRKQLGEEVLE
ncbi:hypothetical protein GIB67_025226 [Kingdonia uniflora]|uniref:Transposase-associated domain-containing protein n=1 Tax=Kingdonia uniflora TaxID=39325 RepID=A0A7J7NYU8_9MAGN|nr:hypothetical protein GIB67_025226 [Kingdonia uniflora]